MKDLIFMEYESRVVKTIQLSYGVLSARARRAVSDWRAIVRENFEKKNAVATAAREIARFEGWKKR